MKTAFLLLSLALALTAPLRAIAPASIDPSQVAIVYRVEDEKSQALAVAYARARNIPSSNLIALHLPDSHTITRRDYNSRIRKPLIKHFDREIWWARQTDDKGAKIPIRSKIRVLLLMKGVPSLSLIHISEPTRPY